MRFNFAASAHQSRLYHDQPWVATHAGEEKRILSELRKGLFRRVSSRFGVLWEGFSSNHIPYFYKAAQTAQLRALITYGESDIATLSLQRPVHQVLTRGDAKGTRRETRKSGACE